VLDAIQEQLAQLWRACLPALRQLPELAVLAAVLAIAALISYLHLRSVWQHVGSPMPWLGPLLVDGLFAAAWLRMRRRRTAGHRVGLLAWLALGLALLATLAGNLAAAVIAGHLEPLALVVAAWPAVAFALVWELLTGHGARPASASGGRWWARLRDWAGQVNLRNIPGDERPGSTYDHPDGAGDTTSDGWNQRRDALLAGGAGRPKLCAELGITDHGAKQLQRDWRKRQGRQAEAG
jgi:hypothetical protein